MRYIGFEGPIGAGKTTLVNAIAERVKATRILERADDNPFLGHFYRDKARYAFQAQIFFFAEPVSPTTRDPSGGPF